MALDISTARADVAKIYIAAFDRVPDSAGLDFWVNSYMAGTDTLSTIAQKFTASTEYVAAYPSYLTNTEYVARIYTNVFNRAADTDGQTFWVNHLVAGTLTRGTLMKAMVDAAAANSSTDGAMLANQAEYGVYTAVQQVPFATANAQLSSITSDAATLTAAKTAVAGSVGGTTGSSFTLTTSIDSGAAFTGGAGNDTFTAIIDDTTNAIKSTLTVLDSLKGGAGTDTLNLDVLNGAGVAGTAVAALPSVTLSGIETMNIRAAVGLTADVSSYTDLTSLNLTQAAGATVLTAASTTNVATSGTADNITVKGGKDVTVTDATASKAIAVSTGAATGNASGKIVVTDTKQSGAGNTIAVDGGTDVTVTTTATATNGAVTIGAFKAATGAVVVTENLNSDGTAAFTGAAIAVTGGATVQVTQNAVITAKDQTASSGITFSAVTVTSDGKTTDVNLAQKYSETEFTKAAVAVVKETSVVTFKAIKSGEALTINGLTFTASKDLTAEQAAQAFASLTDADLQSATGITANGIYTGSFTTGWTSAAASGATVTFTAKDEDEADLTFTGTAATNDAGARIPTQVKSTGTAAVAEVKSANAATYGAVRIDGNATASIKTITLDGYASADLGTTGTDLNALTTLSLANSAGAVNLATSATTLALTVNKVTGAIDLDQTAATITTLNVTTATADSASAVTAIAVKDLNVSGTNLLNLTGSTLSALETVVVSGTAGLNLGAVTASKSINTTATTGKVTATINGTAATYTGGAGVDTVTLAAGAALSKAIDLGAGDDTLVLAANTASTTATLSGGEGTDTLSMDITRAAALDATPVVSFYTNFERLLINNSFGTNDAVVDAETINLANLGFTNYVTTSGTNQLGGAIDTLLLDKFAANATIVLTAQGAITAQLADATGTADVFNVVANVAASDVNFGTLTVAGVETINLTANDTKADDNGDGTTTTAEAVPEKTTLTLTAAAATTVNVTGSAKVDLVLTGSTKVALLDGSTMTGALNVTSVNTTGAVTIKGGSANDTLVSAATSTQADKLIGGAGDDSLTANKGMTEMTGGAGNDTFNIVVASTNVNSAAIITDLSAGDIIKFASADAFKAAAITLADTAVFQDFANAAIASITSDNDLAWFQFGGNTYIVQEKDNSTNANVFTNDEDFIVKISGLVDLGTHASFNATQGTLEIA